MSDKPEEAKVEESKKEESNNAAADSTSAKSPTTEAKKAGSSPVDSPKVVADPLPQTTTKSAETGSPTKDKKISSSEPQKKEKEDETKIGKPTTNADHNKEADKEPNLTKKEEDKKKPKGSPPSEDKKPLIEDKSEDSKNDVNGREPNDGGGKPKEDTVSTATTKAAEEKSTDDMPLRDEVFTQFQGVNPRLVFAICATALGSAFQHGYNLGVINAPLKLMKSWLNETNYERNEEELSDTGATMILSWIVSIYCIGGMLGGALTGFFSERFGRKGGLLFNNVFAFTASIFFGFCKMASSWEMVIIGRFVIGINNGLNAGLAPMFLTEIAPSNLRGAIGTVYQLAVTISILFSQIMGLESVLGTEELWPLLLALTALPAIFQIFTLPFCPESPKFILINKEQRIEAQRALSWLRGSSNVHEELEEIQNEAEAQKLVPKVSLREIVMNPALRIPLIISVMMMIAQQLSGINAAIFFSVNIYESAGLNDDEAMYATIAMGSMNVLMTLVSLVLVERAGRKTLMLIGLSGMMIDTILLTICLALQSESMRWLSYASIVLVILFVIMFATGPGSIPWFLVNELFASNARPIASSIAVAINWTAAFVVGLGFLPIQEALGPYVFLVFTVLLALFIAFTIKKVPETKGRSIDEITAVFKQQAYGGSINRV